MTNNILPIKPKESEFKLKDKVLYQGLKWRVTFIHHIDSLLGRVYMYDLHGKKGRFCCVIPMGDVVLLKRKNQRGK